MSINNNKTSCPFCHGINKCSTESESACWCFEIQIPKSLTALLPLGLVGKSCICPTCINAFKENEHLFKEKYNVAAEIKPSVK